MPLIARSDSIAANTLSSNVLAGEEFEFVPMRSVLQLSSTGSAAGLKIFFEVGGVAVASDALIPPTNRFPIVPDDTLIQVGCRAGERLILRYLNTTGGALTAQTKINIDY